ncbi:MAG: polysaccharide biosynthesis protein [Clostridiales bacterium]|jgi:stage V sporulation protein B|nr:polysaccharide biosynthesis protein [Eubacteriales bacterium]MDH7565990.1 polysaccharide biosynthesis protein [Clostridiales bacterium]
MSEKSVAKGVAVLSAAGITVKLLSLLYLPFLLAIIGDEGNGIYAAAYQVYVLVYVLSNSGIPVAISKLVAELAAVGNCKDALRSFKIARFMLLVLGLVMALLMFALSYPLSRALHYERSYLAILALSPALLFTSVSSAYRGYFQGNGDMLPTAVSQIIEQVVNVVFTLVFAALFLRYGLEAACAGGTIGTSLGALSAAFFLVRFYRKNYGGALPRRAPNAKVARYSYFQLVRKIVDYGIPITLGIGLQYAGNLVDVWNVKSRLLAAGFADKTATQMYSYLYKYQQLLNAPIAVVAALAATILPAVAAAVAIGDRNRVQDRVNYAFRLCFLVTIPSSVGFCVLSGPIYQLLQYGQGSYLMLYGSTALILLAVVQVQTSILQGSGKFYQTTFNLVMGIVGKILTNYFLVPIPPLYVSGAIIGSIVSYCIPIILNGILIRKTLRIKPRLLKVLFKPAMASAIMGACIYGSYKAIAVFLNFTKAAYAVNAAATVISIFLGVVIYFTLMVLFKGISREDMDMLPRKLRKLVPQWFFQKAMQEKKEPSGPEV